MAHIVTTAASLYSSQAYDAFGAGDYVLGRPPIDSRTVGHPRPVSSPTHSSSPRLVVSGPGNLEHVGDVPGEESAHATEEAFAFDTIEDALEAFKRGEFVVVMDDERRENEGDLICAASLVTTEKMAWFIKHTSGYICISLPGKRLDELQLPQMVPNNEEKMKTAYTITVDYKHGTTTGISAHDRALTARKLASPQSVPEDFNRPGHLCPLRAREGGVLKRRGHTEAGLDLCYLTHLPPAALLCELVNDDAQGTMARRDDCWQFAKRWGLKMISVDQLVGFRLGSRGHEGTNGHT